eukprot:2914520-Rhodomonas_salina.1
MSVLSTPRIGHTSLLQDVTQLEAHQVDHCAVEVLKEALPLGVGREKLEPAPNRTSYPSLVRGASYTRFAQTSAGDRDRGKLTSRKPESMVLRPTMSTAFSTCKRQGQARVFLPVRLHR